MHKNNKNSIGNYCIYAIFIDFKVFKIGKADLDRTDKAGNPVRMQQQLVLFQGLLTVERVKARVLIRLYNITTKKALEQERESLQNHYDETGEVPKGNLNSFRPKNK